MANSPTTSDKPTGLQMMLPAKAENVAVIRHALAGLAEEIGMDEPGLADLKTVVTEACMNVVVHAYPGGPGPLSVEATPDSEGLTVVVRDKGSGMRPQAEVKPEQPSLRLGLSLIAALSSSFAISGGLDQGTEVTMRLPLKGGGVDGRGDLVSLEPRSDSTELVTDRPELLAPVLTRVVSALAARRDLSIDRVSDAVLVTDAIAAAAPSRFTDGRVRLGLEDREGAIELRLGPMDPGAADAIRRELEVPDVGGSLEALADELAVNQSGDGEYLVIRFAAAP
ncbi:MAG TPA: ATP-binding protein [Solirubrobacterales bacterium]|nr:ATP-binding protein [Solirubrobacterales bacterium]